VAGAHQARPRGIRRRQDRDHRRTIFPGLIELHNHIGLQRAPAVASAGEVHGPQPLGRPAGEAPEVTAPMAVLAGTPELLPPVARYVECKCLFGGTTTTRLSPQQRPVALRYYRGWSATSSSRTIPALPMRGQQFPTSPEAVDAFLQTLKNRSAIFLHLSEGHRPKDAAAFPRSQAGRRWAITDALSGIHATRAQGRGSPSPQDHGAAVV